METVIRMTRVQRVKLENTERLSQYIYPYITGGKIVSFNLPETSLIIQYLIHTLDLIHIFFYIVAQLKYVDPLHMGKPDNVIYCH